MNLSPDILSINELQYDLPGVPDPTYSSRGENLKRLLKLASLEEKLTWSSFHPANTGMRAKQLPNGHYTLNSRHPDFLKLADHENFGLFPAQYSTGGASKYRILGLKEFSGILWRDFRPNLDLTQYKDAVGTPYDTEKIPLFDKNFTHLLLEIEGREVHLVLLHTVPAFNFGNPQGLNLLRNSDQLAFLRWYLTGASDAQTPNEIHDSKSGFTATPLPKGATILAMGDWNTDIKSEKSDGSRILRELEESFSFVNKEGHFTYEGRFSKRPFRSRLDYILISSDLKVTQSGVYYPPPEKRDLGCFSARENLRIPTYQVFRYKEGERYCYSQVSLPYYQLKLASDHLPVWADLEFKD
jgi:endonuclease/exonuclease/phosphatase family metal-dependent hydrolase